MYVLFAPSALAFVLIAITQIVSESARRRRLQHLASRGLKHPPLRAQGGCPLWENGAQPSEQPVDPKRTTPMQIRFEFQCSYQDMVAYEVIGHADIFSVETYPNTPHGLETCAQHSTIAAIPHRSNATSYRARALPLFTATKIIRHAGRPSSTRSLSCGSAQSMSLPRSGGPRRVSGAVGAKRS